MTIRIITETFTSQGLNAKGEPVGTVQVDLGRGRTITAPAISVGSTMVIGGFVGRYRTSPQPWRAFVCYRAGSLFVHFGRDDRSGRFRKEDGISYEPDTLPLSPIFSPA